MEYCFGKYKVTFSIFPNQILFEICFFKDIRTAPACFLGQFA